MWLGLRMYNAFSGSCNSPADCSDRYLWHHEPGKTKEEEDDVWYHFTDEGFVDVGMSLDEDNGLCTNMLEADDVDENEIESFNCGGDATFACTVSCNG